MVFNKFFVKTLFRVILILLNCIVISSIFWRSDLLFTQLILITILFGQIFELLRFINKTNIELSRFLDGIRSHDYSMNFSFGRESSSFKSLNNSFKGLIETFNNLETEKEAQLIFLQKMINQIDVGIITLNNEDNIYLINDTARRLLEISDIKKWKNSKSENYSLLRETIKEKEISNRLKEVQINGKNLVFSLSLSSLKILSKEYSIITFKDIKSEIQTKEIDAWHKLIRILTHEIMNTVTPISSLTDTALMLLENEENQVKKVQEIDSYILEDIHEALNTVKYRSEGILKFVNDYRKLSKVQKPVLEVNSLKKIIESSTNLFQSKINALDIKLNTSNIDIEILMDEVLVGQVVINLIKNAIESLEKSKSNRFIEIVCSDLGNYKVIQVVDNGPGIENDKLSKIFIPFYSTKKEGSGIGLPLSRQIMNLHGGYMEVESKPGFKTVFSLYFPS